MSGLIRSPTEELEKLRRQHEKLRREHGESHPLVAQLKQRIAGIEGRQQQAANSPEGGNSTALIDYMTQSLESIEAMRSDLQKKFEEDLALSKKAEITLLEESNLRSNLERQRTLFNSVVDQLKQARLVSDYDSVSTQTIAPITVAADQTLTIPLLFLAIAVGVGLGAGVAFLADLLEARVRTLAEIRKLVDLPLIGVIPFIKDNQIVAAGTAGIAQPSEASIGTRGILQDDANQSRVSATEPPGSCSPDRQLVARGRQDHDRQQSGDHVWPTRAAESS